MSREKELAVKVMEFANEFTNWNFQMEKEGNIHLVGTALKNREGSIMTIYFIVGEEDAQLSVVLENCRYDDMFANKKIKELEMKYPVDVLKAGNNIISIHSLMPSEVLDRNISVIIMKRMVDMVQTITDILNFGK